MRHVEFRRFLDENTSLRVRFDLEEGKVLKFMVQMECRFDESEKWTPVVRYDTAHGFAHCDRLFLNDKPMKTEMSTKDYNEALTTAMDDLVKNWRHYRRRYEEWPRKK